MRQYFHPAARQNSVDLTGESHFFSYVDLNKEFARRYGNVTTMPATALVSHHEPISVHFPEQLAGYQQQGALLQQQQYCYCYSNSQYYYQLALDQQQQALATEPAEPRSLSSDNFYSSSSTPLSGHKQTISSPEQQLNCQQPVAGGSDSVQSRQLEDMLNCKYPIGRAWQRDLAQLQSRVSASRKFMILKKSSQSVGERVRSFRGEPFLFLRRALSSWRKFYLFYSKRRWF